MKDGYAAKTVVLAWHVDYWDYLGWKDPFGSKAFTARQKAYRPRLKMRNLVTPEVLIGNGKFRKDFELFVTTEAKKPANVRIRVEPIVADGKVTATVRLGKPVAELPPKGVVRVVLFQRKAVTKVPKGENAGKTLTEYFVVRALKDAGSAADALKKDGVSASIDLPDGVKADNLGLAVLVEDPEKMETIECTQLALPSAAAKPRLLIRESSEKSGNGVRVCLTKEASVQGVDLAVVLRDEWPESARKPVLLGVTAAGNDAMAMAAQHPLELAGLVLVDSPFDIEPATAKALGKDFPVLLVHGTKLAVYVKNHAEVLRKAGVDVTVHSVPKKDSFDVLKASAKVIVSWAKETAGE